MSASPLPRINGVVATAATPHDMDASRASELADQLRGLGQNQRDMLDVIDRLRSATLSEIELPQLVVVGDQSAGKSSVLDAISGIPVPRRAGACTKFATEFRLRRGQGGERISVSVNPGPDRNARERQQLSKMSEDLTSVNKLGDVIREFEDTILAMHGKGGQQKFASRDVLTIEISGPKMPMLTLVDLPGFIHTPGDEQTLDDIETINNIAASYMKKPRTIILAVVSGGSNYANQIVLRKAGEHDRNLTRTLGIITKPDLASHNDIDDEFLTLARNKHIMLDLGWHALRNRSPQEAGDAHDRDEKEREFFAQGVWKDLPKTDKGVDSLRAKLSVLLYDHIADHMPQLLDEVRDELKRTKDELRALGRHIGKGPAMRFELCGLYDQSSRLVEYGTSGGSGFNLRSDPRDCSPQTEAEKRDMSRDFYPRVAKAHQEFEEEMRLHRRKEWFEDREATLSSDEPGRALRSKSNANKDAVKTTYLKSEIEPLLERSTGRTMPGDFSPMLVFDLFEKGSSEWEVMAKRHKDRISKLSTEFLHEVINSTWPERMRSPLWSKVVSKQIKSYEGLADEELGKLHKDRLRRVAPYGPDYLAKIEELQQKLPLQADQTPESHGLFLKMLAFYELTCKTFVTNVIVQVVERHIIHGLDSIFKPIEVFEMDETIVTKIADEDVETQNRRRDLERKVTDLDNIYSEFQGTIVKTKQKKPTVVHASENTTHPKRKSRRAATSTSNDQHPPERTRRVVTRPPHSLSWTSESESRSETESASRVKPNSRLKQAAEGSKRTGSGRNGHDKEVPAARRRASSQVEWQDVWNEERDKPLTKQQPENLVVNGFSTVSKGAKDRAVKLLEILNTDVRANDEAKDARARPVIDSSDQVESEDPDSGLLY